MLRIPIPLRDRSHHEHPLVLSAKIEECPWCGAKNRRDEIILVQIGLHWDRVLCPACKRVFGVKVR